MTFTRMTEWHEISDCGGYTVCAARVMDKYKFQAWKLAPVKGQTAALLGTFSDAPEARKCCEQHAGVPA